MTGRWRAILAALAFVGWLSYLGYAALTKDRGPVVSHIQVAAAPLAVVADIAEVGPDGSPAADRVKVVDPLGTAGLAEVSEIAVVNLAQAQGFDGTGQYLLLLTPDAVWRGQPAGGPQVPAFAIVGQQRSPGHDLAGVGPPRVYRWSDAVKKQFEKLRK